MIVAEGRLKKTKQEGIEIYTAPPPPHKGRIVSIDCHPDIYTVAVIRGSTPHDARKECVRQNLSLEQLLAWAFKEFGPEDVFIMEAGANSFEICCNLREMNLHAMVLESGHVGRQADRFKDNDRIAAERIALVYLAGGAPAVWIPDAKTRERRELLHAYRSAVKDQTASINALKSYLNIFTIRLGRRGLHAEQTRRWIAAQRTWTPLQERLLEDQFSELDRHTERCKRFRQLIAAEICQEPLMLRCMKLLGIGQVNAFALLAVIGEVDRFARPEKLVAYLGLNPGRRTSGTMKIVKVGVGKRGRGDLRSLLMQGAQALMRIHNHPVAKWGWKLMARKGNRNTAVAAVARKLAVQVWHLLSGNPPTALEQDKAVVEKLKKLCTTLGRTMRAELNLPAGIPACVQELCKRISQTKPHVPG